MRAHVRLLNQVRAELLLKDQILDQLAESHSLFYPGSLRPRPDIIQESVPGDKMLDIAARLDALERSAENRLADIRRRRVYAAGLIDRIDKVLYRQILELYYMTTMETYEEHGKTRKPYSGRALLSLADVATRLNRSDAYVRHAHTEALEAFRAVFEKEKEERA